MEYKLLPVKFKQKWIEALRDYKYVQAKGVMYAGKNRIGQNRCCCLGVAEHIQGNSLKSLELIAMPNELDHSKTSKIISQDLAIFLSDKNDNGWSFKKIARWIEKNL